MRAGDHWRAWGRVMGSAFITRIRVAAAGLAAAVLAGARRAGAARAARR